jgi:hypothetical protein
MKKTMMTMATVATMAMANNNNGVDLKEEELMMDQTSSFEVYLKTELAFFKNEYRKCKGSEDTPDCKEVKAMIIYLQKKIDKWCIDEAQKKKNIEIAERMVKEHIKSLKSKD